MLTVFTVFTTTVTDRPLLGSAPCTCEQQWIVSLHLNSTHRCCHGDRWGGGPQCDTLPSFPVWTGCCI